MAAERLSMRQIREILRQKWTLGRSHREVAGHLGAGLGTVSGVERRVIGLKERQMNELSGGTTRARTEVRQSLASAGIQASNRSQVPLASNFSTTDRGGSISIHPFARTFHLWNVILCLLST
jgi:hypothetical protein